MGRCSYSTSSPPNQKRRMGWPHPSRITCFDCTSTRSEETHNVSKQLTGGWPFRGEPGGPGYRAGRRLAQAGRPCCHLPGPDFTSGSASGIVWYRNADLLSVTGVVNGTVTNYRIHQNRGENIKIGYDSCKGLSAQKRGQASNFIRGYDPSTRSMSAYSARCSRARAAPGSCAAPMKSM